MRPFVRVVGVCMLVLAGLGVAPRAQPETARAGDETITSCDETSFETALNAVQSSGGGTLALDCTGTISFTSAKEITGTVTIVGDGVIFDGGGSTRLFIVQPGAWLELINLTLSNGSGDAAGAINNGGTLEVTASEFSGNSTTTSGGAIRNLGTLTVTATTFSGNTASQDGGAILNAEGATATIVASTFAGNSASDSGGAIRNAGDLTVRFSTFDGNAGPGGGGAVATNLGSTSVIESSTFVGNSTSDRGGAIRNGGTTTVTTSTFTGNSAGAPGGAIRNANTLTVIASTFSGNSSGRGGSAVHDDGSASVGSSILVASSAGANCAGGPSSLGYNVTDDFSCGFGATGDVENSSNLALSALGDYGGPTRTMPPVNGSDAHDTVPCAETTPVDQRGAPRPAADCDKGSVELGAVAAVQVFAFVNVSGPVEVGEGASLLVIAFGPNNDDLTYAFDCNNDLTYETAGAGSGNVGTGECVFDTAGVYKVVARVCDGVDTSNCATESTGVTVTASQQVTVALCASYYTGAVYAAPASGQCPAGMVALTVPSERATTFCINRYNGALTWSPRGTCGTGYLMHVVPDDGALNYCQNIYTGKLRYTATGTCSTGERAGVIPGATQNGL